MVAAKPTSGWDLQRTRSHTWAKTDDPNVVICTECSLEFTEDFWLADMVACPGRGFILKKRTEPKHLKE